MAALNLAETLIWLCRIASPTGEERKLCDALAEQLAQVATAASIRRYSDSLVVPLVRSSGGPHVALVGHLDVVRTLHDAPPRIEGDRLYGPGAADMKSGLALMMALAQKSERADVDLTLVFYAREEGPYAENELGTVLDRDPDLSNVSIAIALEPSDNKLQLGCGGSVHASVRFSGRTAHSARPWQGDNAIHKGAPLLTRLAALRPEKSLVDGLEWTRVTSATLASGGRAKNIVPDAFELNLNHRFGPDTTLEQAQQHILELAAGEGEVIFTDLSPAAPPLRDHPLVQALARSGARAVEPKQAWTDVARFAARGIAAANFGPGVQAQAHQRNEWTLISQLDQGLEIIERWLAGLALFQKGSEGSLGASEVPP